MFFLFRGVRIYYSDYGKGSAIVLLHGYLESSEIFNDFEKKLASGFRIISIDLPGHGLSDITEETHSMESLATAINQLIKSLGIKKVFMIGHSLGGYVALAFLELYPDCLSGYSLFHSHPFADSAEALDKRTREIEIVNMGKKNLMYHDNVIKMFAESNLEKFSEALQRSKEIASRINGAGIIAVLKGMMIRPSRLSVMEEGRVPCLWILGKMDNYIPCEIIQSKVKLPSNAKVVILENSGHMGFIEEEDRSVKIVKEFVSGLT